MNPAVRRTIERIDEAAWIPIRYPNAVWDDDTGAWISEAEVAETGSAAFAGTRARATAAWRASGRRAPRPARTSCLPAYRCHAFFTDTTLSTVDADLTHRAHAVIEQVFADLIDDPWRTYRRVGSPPTAPGWPAPRSRTTCCAPAAALTGRAPCPRSRADPAPTVRPRRRPGCPPRPRSPAAPAPTLAIGPLVDAALDADPRPPLLPDRAAGPAPPDGSRGPRPHPSEKPPDSRTIVTRRSTTRENPSRSTAFRKRSSESGSVDPGLGTGSIERVLQVRPCQLTVPPSCRLSPVATVRVGRIGEILAHERVPALADDRPDQRRGPMPPPVCRHHVQPRCHVTPSVPGPRRDRYPAPRTRRSRRPRRGGRPGRNRPPHAWCRSAPSTRTRACRRRRRDRAGGG